MKIIKLTKTEWAWARLALISVIKEYEKEYSKDVLIYSFLRETPKNDIYNEIKPTNSLLHYIEANFEGQDLWDVLIRAGEGDFLALYDDYKIDVMIV